MKTQGRYINSYRSDNDTVIICIEVENEDIAKVLSKEKNKNYLIEITELEARRSLQANRYLWVLCDQIGLKLHLSKEIIYLMKLADYGVFIDISARKDALNDTLDSLKAHFKYVQLMEEHGNYTDLRCYVGSSNYNKKEMQRLLSGVVQDAEDLGIDTWDKEEIKMMLAAWKE